MLERSLLHLSLSWFGAGLAPKDLAHERLELLVINLSCLCSLHLWKHLSQLLVIQVLALAAEALFQVCLGDESSVVDVEVMEGKSHIRFCDSSPAVDSNSEELTVVDLTIMVEIDALEDLINFLLWHIQLIEGGSELAQFECAWVIRV